MVLLPQSIFLLLFGTLIDTANSGLTTNWSFSKCPSQSFVYWLQENYHSMVQCAALNCTVKSGHGISTYLFPQIAKMKNCFFFQFLLWHYGLKNVYWHFLLSALYIDTGLSESLFSCEPSLVISNVNQKFWKFDPRVSTYWN
jgi:hypothetical protein